MHSPQAYVGFVGSDIYKNNLPAIATGNWGCGAFRGNPKLKVLIQLMAAAVAGRSIVYFTFGDTKLRDDLAAMYAHLVHHDIDIGIYIHKFIQVDSSINIRKLMFLYPHLHI